MTEQWVGQTLEWFDASSGEFKGTVVLQPQKGGRGALGGDAPEWGLRYWSVLADGGLLLGGDDARVLRFNAEHTGFYSRTGGDGSPAARGLVAGKTRFKTPDAAGAPVTTFDDGYSAPAAKSKSGKPGNAEAADMNANPSMEVDAAIMRATEAMAASTSVWEQFTDSLEDDGGAAADAALDTVAPDATDDDRAKHRLAFLYPKLTQSALAAAEKELALLEVRSSSFVRRRGVSCVEACTRGGALLCLSGTWLV